jgi:TIGR03009 family protein
MRVVGVILAVLLVAACPPRRGGSLGEAGGVRVVYVQPYVVPAVPVVIGPSDPPIAIAPAPHEKVAETALDRHLNAWEEKTADVTKLRAEFTLKRTDAAFKKDTNYRGVMLWMKPNFFVMRLDNAADKTDYESYICDGKAVYIYSGLQKTLTQIDLPPKWPFQRLMTDIPVLDLFTRMKAKDAKERFDITLFKTDDHYLYLDIKPRLSKDRQEFEQLRVALHGPGTATEKFAYLPAKVYILKPNGDSESWKFTNPQVNLPGVDAKAFQFVEIKDKGWKVQKLPVLP